MDIVEINYETFGLQLMKKEKAVFENGCPLSFKCGAHGREALIKS